MGDKGGSGWGIREGGVWDKGGRRWGIREEGGGG